MERKMSFNKEHVYNVKLVSCGARQGYLWHKFIKKLDDYREIEKECDENKINFLIQSYSHSLKRNNFIIIYYNLDTNSKFSISTLYGDRREVVLEDSNKITIDIVNNNSKRIKKYGELLGYLYPFDTTNRKIKYTHFLKWHVNKTIIYTEGIPEGDNEETKKKIEDKLKYIKSKMPDTFNIEIEIAKKRKQITNKMNQSS